MVAARRGVMMVAWTCREVYRNGTVRDEGDVGSPRFGSVL